MLEHALSDSFIIKDIQIPSDISFGIYLREGLSLATFRSKNIGRNDDFKIVAIVAKLKFESEPYDSFVE